MWNRSLQWCAVHDSAMRCVSTTSTVQARVLMRSIVLCCVLSSIACLRHVSDPAPRGTPDSHDRAMSSSVEGAAGTKAAIPSKSLTLDPCRGLDGSQFRSVETYPGALGSDGKAGMYHLVIQFADGVVTCDSSDSTLKARYTCVDGVISGVPNGRILSGKYDAESGVLMWQGAEFRRIE